MTEAVVKEFAYEDVNHKLGMIMGIVIAFLGIVVASYLFTTYYQLYIRGEKEICPIGCEYVIGFFMPMENDLSFLAGMMALMSVFGFAKKKKWATKALIVSTIVLLQSSFWQMIPSMDIQTGIDEGRMDMTGAFMADVNAQGLEFMPPAYLPLFMGGIIAYVVVAKFVAKVSWSRISISFLTGMAMITAIINGTSSLNMFMKTGGLLSNDTATGIIGDPFFQVTMRLNWLPGIVFGYITYMILLKPTEFTRMAAIASSLMVAILGIPLSVRFTIEKGELSMMSYAVFIVAALAPIIFMPGLWNKLVQPVDLEE